MGWKKELITRCQKAKFSKYMIDLIIHNERMMRRRRRETQEYILQSYSGTNTFYLYDYVSGISSNWVVDYTSI